MHSELASDEKQKMIDEVNNFFGSRFSTDHRMFLKKEKKDANKIFLYSGSILPQLPVEWIGLHFITINEGNIIPSIEGAQFIGNTATKHVTDIGRDNAIKLFRGTNEIGYKNGEGITILKAGELTVGVGLIEDGMLKSMLPLSRKLVKYKKKT